MSLMCRECGGDVVTQITAGILLYRHAVPGADHGPLPSMFVGTAAPRSQPQPTSPTSGRIPVRSEAASPASRARAVDAG